MCPKSMRFKNFSFQRLFRKVRPDQTKGDTVEVGRITNQFNRHPFLRLFDRVYPYVYRPHNLTFAALRSEFILYTRIAATNTVLDE